MNKKYLLLSLVCLTIFGALFTALGSNMFFSDIANIAAGLSLVPVTLPAAAISVTFAIAIFYVIRIYKHPDCFKKITRLYLIIAAIVNLVGLVGVILSAVSVYGTFLSPNPFPGYLIIFLILELLILGGIVYAFVALKKAKEDTGKVEIKVSYVFKTIGWFFFIMIVLNRFGMFLGMPLYVYLRNLYKTFPFYIFLLEGLFLGFIEIAHIFELFDAKKIRILIFVGLGLNVALFAYIAIMGVNDTVFISSLSPALPLERLASKPLEVLIHFLAYLGVGIALFLQNRKALKK